MTKRNRRIEWACGVVGALLAAYYIVFILALKTMLGPVYYVERGESPPRLAGETWWYFSSDPEQNERAYVVFYPLHSVVRATGLLSIDGFLRERDELAAAELRLCLKTRDFADPCHSRHGGRHNETS